MAEERIEEEGIRIDVYCKYNFLKRNLYLFDKIILRLCE